MGVNKKLVIWDLDNTLTDTLGFWATATYPAVQALSSGLQIAEDQLISAIQKAPGQFRFCDFGRLIDWLDDNGHLDSAAAKADPVRKQTLLTALRQQWYDTQAQMTVFYEGALEAMQTVKASGAAQVIDTDTEASSLIRRYWLLAQSAKASGAINDEKDLLDLVDRGVLGAAALDPHRWPPAGGHDRLLTGGAGDRRDDLARRAARSVRIRELTANCSGPATPVR